MTFFTPEMVPSALSITSNSQYSGELQDSFMLVKKQAQALLESVNQLIAVVKEPEIQQALIEVQQGLQKVLDKFDNTGMRDIDSLVHGLDGIFQRARSTRRPAPRRWPRRMCRSSWTSTPCPP